MVFDLVNTNDSTKNFQSCTVWTMNKGNQLVEVTEKLLADKTIMIIGSAVGFKDVCSERIDLIHKNLSKRFLSSSLKFFANQDK